MRHFLMRNGSPLRSIGAGFRPVRFVACCGVLLLLNQTRPVVGQAATRAINLVEAAQTSLREGRSGSSLSNAITALAYAPDGRTLAVGMRDPDFVVLLDPATLKPRDRLPGHLKMVARVEFSPDGKTLVSSGHDGTVRLWDVATEQERLLLDDFQGNVRGLAITPDGRRIVAAEQLPGNKGSTRVWDTQNGRLLGTLADYHRGIDDLAVAPDGLTLATTSSDQTIRLWDLATFVQKNNFQSRGTHANNVAYASRGQSLVAVFDDQTLRVFDAATLGPRYQVKVKTRSAFLLLAVSPDGSTLATTDEVRIQLWQASDGAPLGSVAVDAGGHINAIQFAPDGRSVVVGGLAGSVLSYRLEDRNH